jgi:XTP/dITP diphosphohydrolase
VFAQAELGIAEAEEPYDTFHENALAKARHASRASGLPALADDSGLCVDALGGAPGVHSAYFAGREGGREQRDAKNNAKLLASLGDARKAHYRCVMALVRGADDPQPLLAEGEWHGEIARAPRGAQGFGYDPLFVVAGDGRTAAELPETEKNRISHRGQAAARLLELLK